MERARFSLMCGLSIWNRFWEPFLGMRHGTSSEPSRLQEEGAFLTMMAPAPFI